MLLETPDLIRAVTPVRQALACLLLAVAGMIISHIISLHGSNEFLAAFFGVMLFTIANSVVSIFHESFVKYTWPSWGLYVVLLVSLLLLARLISGVSIWALPEYRMMLLSVVFFYFMVSLLVRLIRLMWEFAEGDEH
jgi:hypothetical protein